MPLVLVKRPPRTKPVSDEVYQNLINSLPRIVAESLDTPPEGRLKPHEVSVQDGDAPLPDYSIGYHDIEIIILAHNFKQRVKNLDQRREWITSRCKSLLPKGTTLSVWILCVPISWGEATA